MPPLSSSRHPESEAALLSSYYLFLLSGEVELTASLVFCSSDKSSSFTKQFM
jgi:hypothetical protein